jgi:hypothetical protein
MFITHACRSGDCHVVRHRQAQQPEQLVKIKIVISAYGNRHHLHFNVGSHAGAGTLTLMLVNKALLSLFRTCVCMFVALNGAVAAAKRAPSRAAF